MVKITTMQKIFCLCLILSLLTVAVGSFGVAELSEISDDVEELYNVHMNGLDIVKDVNICILRISRGEKDLITSTSDEENKAQLKALHAEYSVLDNYLAELPKYFISSEGQYIISQLKPVIQDWRTVHKKIVELGSTTDPAMNAKAQQLSSTEGQQKIRKLAEAIRTVVDTKMDFARHVNEQSHDDFILARNVTVLGVVLSVLLGLGLGGYFARNLLRQLGDEPAALAALALRIAGGDLDAQFNPARKEIGVFGAMKRMVETLKGKIAEADQKSREASDESEKARQATAEAQQARKQAERAKAEGMLQAAGQLEGVVEIVTSASEELSAQVEQSSRGADEQSARVRETATAMEQMNATVLEVAKNAQQAADVSGKAHKRALEGAHIVSDAVKGIEDVHTQSLSIKQDMADLGKQAVGIGQVMNVIADIADQTNLLALNAAIEAARAGDAGRGFAVVADEVRKLAEKTMAATQEVGQAIRGIQEGTQKNIANVDKAGDSIAHANELSVRSGESLKQILEYVQQVNEQVQSIATASEEQSAASEEINRSVEQVATISSETAQAMEQAARAVADLAQQSQVLQRLIADMKDQG